MAEQIVKQHAYNLGGGGFVGGRQAGRTNYCVSGTEDFGRAAGDKNWA